MPVSVRDVTKSFGGERALDRVSLEVASGEIHALLGPNGSGKSTLIGCLSGRLSPDDGHMTIGGTTVRDFTPRTAFAAGTAVIYQHFSLLPSLSIADNIFLGSERRTLGGRIDRRLQDARAGDALTQLGMTDLDPRLPVSALSVGQKQLVEIAKAMRHDPQLLVLDEPTAALGEREARTLGKRLRKLRDSGLAILYVTHLLSEVLELADRVTVLRDGRAVLEERSENLDRTQIIDAIAPQGDATALDRRVGTRTTSPRALELKRFRADGVGPIDLAVGRGEVVAVFGLLGSGRSELVEGLYGIRGKTEGDVLLDDRALLPRSPRCSLKRGMGLVAAERTRQSMFASMSALDNLLLPHFSQIGPRYWRNRRQERRVFGDTAALLRLEPPNATAIARTFSGGNQQKLVVGRWLTEESKIHLLLLDEPTQGIDVGARAYLYQLIRGFAARGDRGVLFTSSDPEEVEALADRALVLVKGRIIAELSGEEISGQRLLELAHRSLT